MRILIKEVDKLISYFKKQVVSEYLVYIYHEDTPIYRILEFGEEALNRRVEDITKFLTLQGYSDFTTERITLENINDKMINNNYPLILSIYLDREIFTQPEMIKSISDGINNLIAEKEANVIAFFMPTDTSERIECLNPLTMSEEDNKKIESIINDIKTNFPLNEKINE
jgi:hypothetical protein